MSSYDCAKVSAGGNCEIGVRSHFQEVFACEIRDDPSIQSIGFLRVIIDFICGVKRKKSFLLDCINSIISLQQKSLQRLIRSQRLFKAEKINSGSFISKYEATTRIRIDTDEFWSIF